MITWSATALSRVGLTVEDADQLVSLSNEDGYESKEAVRLAWEEHEPATFLLSGSPVVHFSFPAEQHSQRYAEQIEALGL